MSFYSLSPLVRNQSNFQLIAGSELRVDVTELNDINRAVSLSAFVLVRSIPRLGSYNFRYPSRKGYYGKFQVGESFMNSRDGDIQYARQKIYSVNSPTGINFIYGAFALTRLEILLKGLGEALEFEFVCPPRGLSIDLDFIAIPTTTISLKLEKDIDATLSIIYYTIPIFDDVCDRAVDAVGSDEIAEAAKDGDEFTQPDIGNEGQEGDGDDDDNDIPPTDYPSGIANNPVLGQKGGTVGISRTFRVEFRFINCSGCSAADPTQFGYSPFVTVTAETWAIEQGTQQNPSCPACNSLGIFFYNGETLVSANPSWNVTSVLSITVI